MSNNFNIGLSGLTAAQNAFSIIGNNIANAATPGYHCQRINLQSRLGGQNAELLTGGGVSLSHVTRLIDQLLENEILRQQSNLGQTSKELTTLQTVETTFGELSSPTGLGVSIDEFFNTLHQLSAHPSESTWQNSAVNAAQAMAAQFRTIAESLNELQPQITAEAQQIGRQINVLTGQIAEMNKQIQDIEIPGGQTHNLKDQRDQRIFELSHLADIKTIQRDYGVTNVTLANIPVVTGGSTTKLEVGLNENNQLGLSIEDKLNYNPNISGGRLGALLTLKNQLVHDCRQDLDTLASTIIRQINHYHTQGVGSYGSFSELTGWSLNSENLDEIQPPVSNGSLFIRVTDTTTGQIERYEVTVNTATDTLTSIASQIASFTGIEDASVAGTKLSIRAEQDYTFDFLPAVLPEPTASNLTSEPPESRPDITVSGIYEGSENQTFTFTVIGIDDDVGNGNLKLKVENGVDEITTLNVGAGYSAGVPLDLGNGVKVALSYGKLNVNDTFQVKAFADSDTANLLAATGLNTFFRGNTAGDMTVCTNIIDQPKRLAVAIGPEMNDQINARRMAELREENITELGSSTPGEFYRCLITGIGQQVALRKTSCQSIESIIQNLQKRQSETSGVDVNEQAAQMLIFEQMFQAMAKYLGAVQTSLTTIMEVI